jgi:nicotinate-nucleotide pyrophosphorylase (carboxylating)
VTPPLPQLLFEDTVRRALKEDLGRAGDITSDAVVPRDARAKGLLVARADLRVAGLDVAALAFRLLDPEAEIRVTKQDGSDAAAGDTLATVSGRAGALLSAERVALNFLGRLSGIATTTRAVVAAVAHTQARIVSTRKTTPGLRVLEKYAVRCGGGQNHRLGLDDAVLIKDNHRALAGGVKEALSRARANVGHMVKIEIEVDTLDQLKEALEAGADVVLLDNMPPETLRQAVALARGRCLTEASGGITPANVRAVAETGVDLISLGWLTHSAPSADVAFDL